MKLEVKNLDNYDENSFYTIYRLSFSHNYRTETLNISEWSYEKRKAETKTDLTS
jgi:hypothetical protein